MYSRARAATIGFNLECVEYKKMIFSLWDLGGSQDARSFWRMYYANTQAIIFVVDSSDLARMVRGSRACCARASPRARRPSPIVAPPRRAHRTRRARTCIE